MQTTPNYGLKKIELNDVADITAINDNWDVIDDKLGKELILTDTVTGKRYKLSIEDGLLVMTEVA